MSSHPHSPDSPNNLDNVMRKDGQVAATSAMQPMIANAPIHGYTIPGWHCLDCGAKGVEADHLCDARASRLEALHGRPITAQEHASWQSPGR